MMGMARDNAEEGCRVLSIVWSVFCTAFECKDFECVWFKGYPGDNTQVGGGQSLRTEGTIKGKATTALELGSCSGDGEGV